MGRPATIEGHFPILLENDSLGYTYRLAAEVSDRVTCEACKAVLTQEALERTG